MPPDPPAAGTGPPTPPENVRRWLTAAAVFAAGALAGGLVTGLTGLAGSQPAPGSTAPPPAASRPQASTQAGQVTANLACVKAINEATSVQNALRNFGLAAQRLNASKIDQIVRQLEPIQTRLNADSRACQIITRRPDGSLVTTRPAAPASIATPTP